MSLIESWKQPCPYDSSINGKVVTAAFFGLFIFGFLLVFKPFELDQFSTGRLLWIVLIYGAVTFGCVFMATVLVPLLFPHVFNEKVWTTGKHILFTAGIIFFVGLVNFFVSPLLVDSSLSLEAAIWFQGITLAVGLLPVVILILIRQNQLLKRFSREAAAIEEKLKARPENTEEIPLNQVQAQNKIVFQGDYQNENLELYADDLHVISSASNYVKLYHLQKDKLIYSILRCTLRKAEEVILPYQNFFKCHRTFIINLDKVNHVQGNAQGYKIRVEGYEDLIPVSRNLSAEFSDKLLAFRKQYS